MAKDEKSRQKKLARKNAKRKAKQQQIRSSANLSKVEQAARYAHRPVLACQVPKSLLENGMGSVVFARGSETGEVAAAVLLLDTWCLGVKDVFFMVGGPEVLEQAQVAAESGGELENWDPACLKKLVLQLTAWSRDLGFDPHPDTRRVLALMGDSVDADACQEVYQFGKDGKPMFFAGPHDGPRKVRQVLSTLERSCGEGGYHYTLPAEGGLGGLPLPTHLLELDDIIDEFGDIGAEFIEGELDDDPPPPEQS